MVEVSEGGRPLLRLGSLLALIGIGVGTVAFTPVGDVLSAEGVGSLVEWLRATPGAPIVYIIVYTAASALAMPGSVLTLAGGAIFGVTEGILYTTVAANLGANAAFGLSRALGRSGVERLAGSRLEALDRATAAHGFRGLLMLRWIPIVPFNALNFGAGLTPIPWVTYATATAIGIFPGTVVYIVFADALLAGSQEASREALIRVVVTGLILVLLSLLPTIARRFGIGRPGETT